MMTYRAERTEHSLRSSPGARLNSGLPLEPRGTRPCGPSLTAWFALESQLLLGARRLFAGAAAFVQRRGSMGAADRRPPLFLEQALCQGCAEVIHVGGPHFARQLLEGRHDGIQDLRGL
jgi:hypothetical protein